LTLLLSRREVAGLMRPEDWLAAAETAFRAAADGRAEAPPPIQLPGSGGAFHAKGASLALDRRYVALKLNGNFAANPDARGLPTIQGAILLCDGETGSLLAILDSIGVTLRRTAAATALAARFLARPDSETILVCGCGPQGAAQLAALREVLPLRRCLAWDRDPRRAASLGGELVDDLAAAVAASEVIVTCTTSAEPFLETEWVRPGSFVAAVGADNPAKNEIEPALMAKAMVVADSIDQCAAMGDLRAAIAAGAMRREDVHGELSALVAGTVAGREDDSQITLFDSTGIATQDAAAAALIYERAVGRGDIPSVELAG
jgi:alanine dehydrogenase